MLFGGLLGGGNRAKLLLDRVIGQVVLGQCGACGPESAAPALLDGAVAGASRVRAAGAGS